MASWLLLACGLAALLFAWNAIRPTYAPPYVALFSFFAGWFTSELAAPLVVAHVAFASLLVALGGVRGFALPGLVGLAAYAAACAILAEVLRRALAAHDAVERALGEQLGEAYAAALPAALNPRAARRAALRQWHPLPKRRAIRCERDLVYGDPAQRKHRLDVWHPAKLPERAPVLVYVHGGGWVLGSKRTQGRPLLERLAEAGWVCVTIDYRLSPRATFPDHIVDVKRAIAWVKANVHRWGGDASHVVLAGNSAGGHLASLAALTANDPAWQPGFEGADTSVAACLSFYGVLDLLDRNGHSPHRGRASLLERHVFKARQKDRPELFDAASPIARVHADAPPFFVIHGDSDTLVPVGEARSFVEALRKVSRAPVVYAEIPGAQHAFEVFPSIRTELVLAGVHRFVEALRAPAEEARVSGASRGR